MIWQVVLAAGASRRMGRPKALLEVGGHPAVRVIVSRGLDAGCGGAVVVVGSPNLARRVQDAVALMGPLPGAESVRIVVNPEPEAGRTGTMQLGLEALPKNATAALVHPVDHPLVGVETLRALLSPPRPTSAGEGSGPWVVEPTQDGRRGHPFVVERSAFSGLAALRSDEPLHHWMRQMRADGRSWELEVDDPAIHANLDTPADLDEWGL